jgi:hypothetical protein
MKPVTAYKSFNGVLFDTEKECADYESHCYALSKIIDQIPRFKRDEDFLLGKRYHQHDPESFSSIRDQFFEYMYEKYNNPIFKSAVGQTILPVNRTIYRHFLSARRDDPSLVAWSYFECVDNEYREWSTIDLVDRANTNDDDLDPVIL